MEGWIASWIDGYINDKGSIPHGLDVRNIKDSFG